MADPTIWMPLFIGDHLAETARLTTEQHGAYILLLLDYWRNGPPPDDDDILSQITKLDRPRWKKQRPMVARLFQVEDGTWNHARSEAQMTKAKALAQDRSNKARSAAVARWENPKVDAPSNAWSMPQAMLGECHPPSSSPAPSQQDEIGEKKITSLLAFTGKTIRLNARDFGIWAERYSAIVDLRAELGALDDWLQGQEENVRKKWFQVVSGLLNKKHQAALCDAKKTANTGFEFGSC